VDGVPTGSGLGVGLVGLDVGLTVGVGVGVPAGVPDGLGGQAATAADGCPEPCTGAAAAIAGRDGFT
jgi:uncharacterized metal-binding protein